MGYVVACIMVKVRNFELLKDQGWIIKREMADARMVA
jgi:hypothetical protein